MPEKKVRFAEFELDFGRFQLLRAGNPVRLEGLPLQLLMYLVDRHRQLVTREEIANVLWGKDVFVDIEQGINTAIRKVRIALGDDSAQPQYLQTVVGRGSGSSRSLWLTERRVRRMRTIRRHLRFPRKSSGGHCWLRPGSTIPKRHPKYRTVLSCILLLKGIEPKS